jgi:hypothetical protein
MDCPPLPNDPAQRCLWIGHEWLAHVLSERIWDVPKGDGAKRMTVESKQNSERRLAEAKRLIEHGVKYRREVAG